MHKKIRLMSNKKIIFFVTFFIVAIVFFIMSQQREFEPSVITLPDEKPDFSVITDVNQKKQAFFRFLEPDVQRENQRIVKERSRLLRIQTAFITASLNPSDIEYAHTLADAYYLAIPTQGITEDWLSAMLLKVNVLPKALVLTQAANESAWGTSRFATQANNYFGQWCYKAGCGLIPLKREDGATHEVTKFDSATDSVHAYFMNVNRNRAYAELRQIRGELMRQGRDLTSVITASSLTKGLLKYSERGHDYVDDLLSMIRVNNQYWIVK